MSATARSPTRVGTTRGRRAAALCACAEARRPRVVPTLGSDSTLGFDQLRNLEPGVRDHPKVGLVPLARSGQVAVAEEGIGRVQGKRLELSEVDLASPR